MIAAEDYWQDERDAAQDARDQDLGAEDDRPSWREAEADEHPPPYRVADDEYRGTCGGCLRPVSAFVGHEGGHEGSCLWRGGPFHPSCREADKRAGGTMYAAPVALSGARP